MADQTSQPRTKGRRLPPITQDIADNGNTNTTPRKQRKHKTEEVDDTPVPTKSKEGSDIQAAPTRKKKRKPVGSSREALVSEGEALSDRTDVSARKKKKKKKAPAPSTYDEGTENLGLAAELTDLQEDVIGRDDDKIESKWTTAPMMKSEHMNKVFVEKQNGFKSKDKFKLDRKRAEQEELSNEIPEAPPSRDTMYYALGTHKVFHTLCVFLQGLLAGIALFHITSTWLLSNYGYQDFLEYYHKMALPVSCMYYFLFALATVSVLDRYDVGRPTRRLFTRCCTMQSGGVAIIIYFIGIIFTAATTHLDDKIGLYEQDDELWNDEDEAKSDISTWRILNLMRGLMAILGWIVISLRPETDRLTKTLKSLDENIFGEDFVTHLDNVVTD